MKKYLKNGGMQIEVGGSNKIENNHMHWLESDSSLEGAYGYFVLRVIFSVFHYIIYTAVKYLTEHIYGVSTDAFISF